jgi:hypothetical protein
MENETKTVSGLIIPVDWDSDGNVLGVAIFDKEEKRYVIIQDKKGKELLKLIRAELEVDGDIKKGKKGKPILKVKDFRLKVRDEKQGGCFNLDKEER